MQHIGYKEVLWLPKITIDMDKCTGAGVCSEVCPMNVYDIEDRGGGKKSYPTRMQDCIMCLACTNACPNQAITVEE